VIDAARAGAIDLVVPDLVIEEVLRALAVKAEWGRERLRRYVRRLDAVAVDWPEAPPDADSLTGDPDDDRILACAMANDVDVLVSGNRRHLLPVGSAQGVRILTPQALLAELRSVESS
jgi:predicted nucleic acid-binding protein